MKQRSRLVQYLYGFGLLLSQKTGYLAQNMTKEGIHASCGKISIGRHQDLWKASNFYR
ncbi:MAG TPA: hypothetical protein VFT71_06160 [Candidatus Nitrosocosmicus sp.]|jgi:hypothetical protein|nr:hypothetical protein [Candidatus Nitrosocosmicus sp.]